MRDPDAQTHAILGAGLAGLSLAVALVRDGVREPIVLIDRRSQHGRDRTWCFWDVRPTPFSALASHRWDRWRVIGEDGTAAVHRSPAHPYLHLDSRALYAAALAELERAPNVHLRLGERVLGIEPGEQLPVVRTERESFAAGRVYDGLASASPLLRGRAAAAIELAQSFLGWEVETEAPVFGDAATATLMDFRVPQDRGLRFLYVLPFSPTHALVEDTSIAAGGVPAGERRALLEAWLAARTPGWEVRHEERGRIAMSTHRYALEPAPRVHPIGTAAGAVRPSSGYAFVRTQAHCVALARAIATGGRLPHRLGEPRHDALDAVFLRALAREPEAFPERFRRLAGGTPAATFARFMSDASTPLDEARVIAALPKRPFLVAAARAAAGAQLSGPAASRRWTTSSWSPGRTGVPGAGRSSAAAPAGASDTGTAPTSSRPW